MTPELTALTLAALLQAVQFTLFAIPANLELTPKYTSSPRDLPPLPADAGGDELHALFIEHACSNLEVYLNGQKLHSGGRMSAPYTHNCNHPQLVTLPAALLRSAGNVLDIRLVDVTYPFALDPG